jgi:hypothetical protein
MSLQVWHGTCFDKWKGRNNMSAIQSNQRPPTSSNFEDCRPGLGKSAAATLIELGISLAGADFTASKPGLCCQCCETRNPHSSTAQCPTGMLRAGIRSRRSCFSHGKGLHSHPRAARNSPHGHAGNCLLSVTPVGLTSLDKLNLARETRIHPPHRSR